MDNPTILAGLGNGLGSGRHRSANIAKVENGYMLTVAFSVEVPPNEFTQQPYWQEVTKTYVFYSTEELLFFLKSYLDAAPETLHR